MPPSIYDYYKSLPPGTNFRRKPHLYRVGRGEQGVLIVEPYKSEILPHWRFATVAAAKKSAAAIYKLFLAYRVKRDFVGMDMARKFLQMGYTRARRYANYKGGRKYDESGHVLQRGTDPVKTAAAKTFHDKWRRVREDTLYVRLRKEHIERRANNR